MSQNQLRLGQILIIYAFTESLSDSEAFTSNRFKSNRLFFKVVGEIGTLLETLEGERMEPYFCKVDTSMSTTSPMSSYSFNCCWYIYRNRCNAIQNHMRVCNTLYNTNWKGTFASSFSHQLSQEFSLLYSVSHTIKSILFRLIGKLILKQWISSYKKQYIRSFVNFRWISVIDSNERQK